MQANGKDSSIFLHLIYLHHNHAKLARAPVRLGLVGAVVKEEARFSVIATKASPC